MAWTEELKAKVVKMYKDEEPTPETSTEIIKQISEEVEQSPNGIRMVLVQAGVYVKKEAADNSGGTKTEGSKRVSKETSIQALKDLLEKRGAKIDDDILDKLTGKAAVYLTGVINGL